MMSSSASASTSVMRDLRGRGNAILSRRRAAIGLVCCAAMRRWIARRDRTRDRRCALVARSGGASPIAPRTPRRAATRSPRGRHPPPSPRAAARVAARQRGRRRARGRARTAASCRRRAALALFDYFLSATGEESRGAAPRAHRSRDRATPLARGGARRDGVPRSLPRVSRGRAAPRGRRRRRRERRSRAAPAVAARAAPQALRRGARGDALRRRRARGRERRSSGGACSATRRSSADGEARRLEALEASLPAAERASRDAGDAARAARGAGARAARRRGGTDGEIRALREERVGAEAADRLAALDERRAAWAHGSTPTAPRATRSRRTPSLDPAARDAAIESLRARLFDEPERLRVRAIDERELGADAR